MNLSRQPQEIRARVRRFLRLREIALASAMLLASSAQTAFAQTWIGTTSSDWAIGTNWTGGVPAFNGTATFNAITANDPSLAAPASVGKLSFVVGTDFESFTGSGTLTINGVAGVGIDNAAAVASSPTFSIPITVGASQTWQATNATSGSLSFLGNVALGANTLTLRAANAVNTISLSTGVISGSGNLVISGAGTTYLSGNNTFTGKTSVQSGTLSVNSLNSVVTPTPTAGSALGTPSSVANGTIDLGSTTSTGTLAYTGVGQSTDRVINLAGTTGGGTIDSGANGALVFTGNLTATGAGAKTLTLQGSSTGNIFNGAIVNGSGTTSIAKNGTGAWTLSGNNTYTGATTISNGTLLLGHVNALGTTAGSTTVSAGALDLNGITLGTTEALTINGTGINSAGALTNSGAQASYTGNVTLGSASSIGGAGTIVLNGAAGLAGNFLLTKVGSGTLVLLNSSGARTGGLQVNQGYVSLLSSDAIGASSQTITLAGGGLSLNSALSVNPYLVSVTANASISSGRFVLGGAGITHTLGNLTVNTSTLSVDSGNSGANTAYGLTFGATTLTGDATFSIANNGSGLGTLTLGALTDGTTLARTLTFGGTGTTVLGTTATSLINGTAVNITGGNLSLGAAGALGSLANVTLSGTSNLAITAGSQTFGALNGIAGTTVGIGAGTLTVGASNNLDSSYAGIISGSGNLTKGGTGTLTLSGNNTFTGNTTISGGTLKLGATGTGTNTPLGTIGGSTTVTGTGAALDLNGFTLGAAEALTLSGSGVNTSGALTNSAGAVSYSGNITQAAASAIGGTGNITLNGNLTGAFAFTKQGTNTLTLAGASNNVTSVTINRGTLEIGGAAGTLTVSGGVVLNSGGTFTIDNTAASLANRLATGNTDITANGGTLNYLHNAAAGTSYSESIGTGKLVLNSGGFNINLSQAATGQTSVFGVDAITRNAGSTILFTGTGLGGTQNQIVSTTALISSGGILKGALMTGHTGGNTYDLVTATGAGAAITASTTYTATIGNSATTEYRPTSNTALGAGTYNVNALVFDDNRGLNAPTADRTITFNNAAMLVQAGGNSTISASGNNEYLLAFATGTEGIITTIGNLTLQRGNSNNLSGDTGITKAGGGMFNIQTGNANTGILTINEGTWRTEFVGAVTSHTTGSDITANKGVLELANNNNATNLFTGADLTVNGDFTIRADRTSGGAAGSIVQSLQGASGTAATLTIVNDGTTITSTAGANVTSGTIGLTLGAVTLTGNDATFASNNNGVGGSNLLTFGAVSGTNRNFTVTGNGSTTITGVIGTLGGTVTKNGSGTLTLNSGSSSTYIGATTINNGTLALGASNQFAATAPVIVNGGTFALGAFSDGLGAVTLKSGNITSSTGVLTGTAYNLQSGNVTAILAGGTSVLLTKSTSGTVTLSGNNTFTGKTSIQEGTLSVASLNNVTGGTANSNLGAPTTVANGTIDLGFHSTTGTLAYTGAVATTNRVINLAGTTGGGTIDGSGSGALTFSSNFTATGSGAKMLTLQGSTAGNTISGSIVDSSGATSVTKAGNSTSSWILSGNNSFTGPVAVTGGTLSARNNNALGATTSTAGTTVSSGATLDIQGGRSLSNGTLTLAGIGITAGTSGALTSSGSGTNTWTGNIALSADTTIRSTAGADLNLGNASPGYSRTIGGFANPNAPTDTNTFDIANRTLTFTGSGNTTVNARITGTSSGNLTIGNTGDSGTGIVQLYANQNTFSGLTRINDGTLFVNTTYNTYPGDPIYPNYFGINGPVIIGDGNGTAGGGSAILKLNSGTLGAEVIDYHSTITINQDGKFLVQPAQSIDLLTFNGAGVVDTSTSGGLYLNNSVIVNGVDNQTATITRGGNVTDTTGGSLSLTIHNGNASATDRIFNVNHTGNITGVSDLTVTAFIVNGSLTKTGNGTMTINNNNLLGYGGTTTVDNGILNIQHSNSLGLGTGVAGNGTIISANATGTLQLQGGITVANEMLTLNGNGFANPFTGNTTNGALQNVSGSNTWAGAITLASNSRIQSEAGSLLTINGANGTVSSANNSTLEVTGSGNVTISADVGLGTGGITKNGSGLLILSGTNSTYAGNTLINSGNVSLQSNKGLGASVTGTTTVNATGAALEINKAAGLTTSETLTLNGTGISSGGALRNVSGNNTINGLITVASAARINSDANTLTLSGGITSSNVGLTVGGASNTTVSGNVSLGTGTLTKDGAGTATFSGGNTTVGATTMSAGTLNFNSGNTTTGSLTINAGTTNFASANATTGGAAVNMNAGALNVTSGNLTTGQVHLLGGASSTISVATGATLTTAEFDSAALTTLAIATGGRVDATFGAGNTTFSGKVDGVSGSSFGTLALHGTSGTSQVTFNSSFESVDNVGAPTMGITLEIGGSSIGTMATPLKITLAGATTLQFYTIHITGDTILDFGNSSASVLNSANLIIDAGVKISVINWISLTDAWYAKSSFTQQTSGNTTATATLYTDGYTINPNAPPQNQITFSGFDAANTAWVTPAAGSYFDHEIRPVPEPSTYGAIFVSGCVSLLGLRRYLRRRAAAAPRA